jgi:hypothetical protein
MCDPVGHVVPPSPPPLPPLPVLLLVVVVLSELDAVLDELDAVLAEPPVPVPPPPQPGAKAKSAPQARAQAEAKGKKERWRMTGEAYMQAARHASGGRERAGIDAAAVKRLTIDHSTAAPAGSLSSRLRERGGRVA